MRRVKRNAGDPAPFNVIGKHPVDGALAARLAADLDRLIPSLGQIGLAVSGGADSVALLLLAAAARPGRIQAATVDHGLRSGSAAEAAFVGSLCHGIGVPHATLDLAWEEPPATAIQEQSRVARYAVLGRWAEEAGLTAVATGHHLDDQVETLLMRLTRGAGVRGLAGMRESASCPGYPSVPLIRPLLTWRRLELEAVCADAGVEPVQDPSNADERFERARTRKGLGRAKWLDPDAIARSAANLARADEALDWATQLEWATAVECTGEVCNYRPSAPIEIRRRILTLIIARMATEGESAFRGREVDRLLAALQAGGTATLRGVRCSGGATWRFAAAQRRRA